MALKYQRTTQVQCDAIYEQNTLTCSNHQEKGMESIKDAHFKSKLKRMITIDIAG